MLPATHRLSTHVASSVRRSSQRISTPELIVQYALLPNVVSPQFFIQVPAKRIKTAVARHRLKRVITETLRLYFLDRVVACAIILTVQVPLPETTPNSMRQLLEVLFQKAGLLK